MNCLNYFPIPTYYINKCEIRWLRNKVHAYFPGNVNITRDY